jgi:hypothetical protein
VQVRNHCPCDTTCAPALVESRYTETLQIANIEVPTACREGTAPVRNPLGFQKKSRSFPDFTRHSGVLHCSEHVAVHIVIAVRANLFAARKNVELVSFMGLRSSRNCRIENL